MPTWTFRRVIKTMYERSSTGILEVLGPDGEVRLHLDSGKIVGLESDTPAAWTLDDFLLQSDTLSVRELRSAHRRAARKDQTLEAFLVAAELVSPDVLGRFVELEVREVLFKLFERSGITCRLDPDVAPVANPWVSPIPIPFLLKEAARRAEAWPELHRAIPHHELVFDKVDAHIAEIFGQGRRQDIGANERVVYYYVNGKRTVEQVAFAACLGQFDAYAALSALKKQGLITLREARGKGQAARQGRVIGPAVVRGVSLGVSAILVAALILLRPGALASPRDLVVPYSEHLDSGLHHAERERYRAALTTYLLGTGALAQPGDLSGANLLTAEQDEALHEHFRVVSEPAPRRFTLESRLPMWQ